MPQAPPDIHQAEPLSDQVIVIGLLHPSRNVGALQPIIGSDWRVPAQREYACLRDAEPAALHLPGSPGGEQPPIAIRSGTVPKRWRQDTLAFTMLQHLDVQPRADQQCRAQDDRQIARRGFCLRISIARMSYAR